MFSECGELTTEGCQGACTSGEDECGLYECWVRGKCQVQEGIASLWEQTLPSQKGQKRPANTWPLLRNLKAVVVAQLTEIYGTIKNPSLLYRMT